MGEGWENARRRGEGNDWVDVALACEGVVTLAELDTSRFLGNAPAATSLTGRTGDGGGVELLPAHAVVARPPAPVRAPRPRVCAACGWTSSPTGAWPGCGCGGAPRPQAAPSWDGAGSPRCPTSRRWRCSARWASTRRRRAG
ncbi:hypothetical protein [Modestobacter sp. DSM 44400]|uniref:hypothetical protein n=1 Tax=Modestobacter sp. DSM 44400 TaxID=1550230 RepID=UPI0020C8D0C1|nr:hypothetical protein [Modestobacter sp. DSM 44400]